MLGALAFNLLVNAALSFAGAFAMVWVALRLFRVGPDRWQLSLLALPWLKVAWDAAHGIPEGSFFWQRLSGARQELGSFQLGLGANQWGPLVQLRLGAKLGERTYSQSAAELLDSGLSRLWPQLPVFLTGAVLLVSCLLATRRLLGWLAHALSRRRSRQVVLTVRRGRLRDVAVVIDTAHAGAPYAAGVLRPCVVFSAAHFERLSEAEREACLLHELSHVAHGDTLSSPLLALLTDVFWFLPGGRWVLERYRSVMELRADAAAVTAGAAPEALASALVATGELLHESASPGVGLVRERLLLRRVRRLLQPATEPRPRAGFQHAALRVVFATLLFLGVLQAVFFGNQAAFR